MNGVHLAGVQRLLCLLSLYGALLGDLGIEGVRHELLLQNEVLVLLLLQSIALYVCLCVKISEAIGLDLALVVLLDRRQDVVSQLHFTIVSILFPLEEISLIS